MSIARLLDAVPPMLRPLVELQAAQLAPDERAALDSELALAWDAALVGDFGPARSLAERHGISEDMVRGALAGFGLAAG